MEPESSWDRRFRLAAAGDRDAFAALVREHQSMVFSIACNFLRDEGSAEELAQEVFLELYRALPSLDSAAHVTNWLRRVTAHRSIDESRRRARRPGIALEDVPEPASPPVSGDPMMAALLGRLTASLPAKARAVVVLRFQEDLEPAEIAGVLDMPVNTVKSHLQRSLAMLRGKLERARVRT
jgi:RNA polymerase sigma-70 factor (ECF subfamily)